MHHMLLLNQRQFLLVVQEIVDKIKLPWGRKVRQAIETEKKRAALKAKQALR